MNLKMALESMGYGNIKLLTDKELRRVIVLILNAEAMTPAMHDTLRALHARGPLWDGDIPSKTGRDALIELDLATKVVVKGEEGFNACTLLGAEMLRILPERHDG